MCQWWASTNLDCESCSLCSSNRTICVDDTSILSSSCEFESFVLPSGNCSAFMCPSGFYRNSTKHCNKCHFTCFECNGHFAHNCLSCSSNSYLKLSSNSSILGTCETKSTNSTSYSIFVSNNATIVTDFEGNPLTHKLRNGSANYPFLDLRDALIRAN